MSRWTSRRRIRRTAALRRPPRGALPGASPGGAVVVGGVAMVISAMTASALPWRQRCDQRGVDVDGSDRARPAGAARWGVPAGEGHRSTQVFA
ncbi:hypothetical protein ACFPM0_09070 [Pseudonocardia sulfidoxydans]|uniref:hypothetical protein n=1 Tax=Pseudonocardia sulfidoxydans TaxID=54011 RepID=UPI00361D2066